MLNNLVLIGIAAAITALAGCGGPTPVPIVDMEGVNPVTYNRDLASCVKDNASKALVIGNGVTRCMVGKGYKILEGYGR
jgi:hypothetical protein